MCKREQEAGKAAFRERDFPKAIVHYEQAVNIQPEAMACWNNLALLLMETKAFQEVRFFI